MLSSTFAKLRLAGTSVVGEGTTAPTVHVTWRVVFRHAAAGEDYRQLLRITDDSGGTTGYDRVGTWSVVE